MDELQLQAENKKIGYLQSINTNLATLIVIGIIITLCLLYLCYSAYQINSLIEDAKTPLIR